MWLICEIINIKDKNNIKQCEDIKFSTNDYILRIVDENNNEIFNSSKIVNLIKVDKN